MSTAAEEVLGDLVESLETDRYQVTALTTNRAWLSLKEHLLDRRERTRKRVIDSALGRKAKREPLDQREVDYARGMIDTIDFILALPERMGRERDAQS